jgi:hypothetical protein
MNGLTVDSEGEVVNWPPESWEVLQVSDMDLDGKSDVIFRNQASGQVYGWKMDGLTVMAQADFGNNTDLRREATSSKEQGDGKPDLLWWYAGSGTCISGC